MKSCDKALGKALANFINVFSKLVTGKDCIMGIFGADSSSDAPGFTPELSSEPAGDNVGLFDKELEDFLLQEKQKASINAQILDFNDLCWEKCLTDKPGSKLSSKAETCLSNCVDRFVDTTVFIMNRFAVSMQKTSM